MLYAFPDRMDLWKQYAILRAESLKADGDGKPAQDFYRANQEAMDAGAKVAWPARFEPGDMSALETAMKLWIDDKYSFMAECQNEPLDEDLSELDLKPDEVLLRYGGRDRGVLPIWAGKLTAFIDVQGSALYYVVAGWDSTCFTGHVVDYGVWPDQPGRRYYTLGDLQYTLQTVKPHVGIEGQIRHGLDQLAERLLGREWQREGGTVAKIDRLFCDANYQSDTVYEWARATKYAVTVIPTHGRPIGAKAKPLDQYAAKPGEKKGFHWFLTASTGKRAIRHVLLDVNYWKTFLVQRFRQPIGCAGALTLFGSTMQDADHSMFADQMCSEKSVKVEANGRTVMEWGLRPGRPDNHWLDGLVGCAAAASYEGVVLPGQAAPKKGKRSWREQQQRKLG